MKHKPVVLLGAVVVLALLAGTVAIHAANPTTISSSTMVFEGALTDHGDGTYSGVLPMIVDGGYDVYAKDGATAWFGDDPGTGAVWDSETVANHDAWPSWDPDTPDWYQYSLELTDLDGDYTWALRNHPGATETDPWYTGDYPPMGVPMSGLMHWGASYAEETDVGAYLPGTGTPEIPGGAASYGGGPQAWDMDWSWGSEMVPLQYPGFDVQVDDLGGGNYRVTLTPAEGPVVNLTTGQTYATIQAAVDDAGSGHILSAAPGTYAETVTLDDSTADGLTIQGSNPADRPEITGGVLFNNTGLLDGITLKDLILKGDADPSDREAIVSMKNSGAVNDLVMEDCLLDGENVALTDGEDGRNGIVGNNLAQSYSITGCEFKNILGWSVADMDASTSGPPYGGNELVLTSVTFSDNDIHDCNGSVALRGNHTTRTIQVDAIGNTWDNIGGVSGYTGLQWAALEVNNAVLARIQNNTVNDVQKGPWEGEAFQIWNVETVDISGNTLTNNYEGIYFYSDGVGGTYCGTFGCPVPGGSVSSNSISGNSEYGLKVEAGASGGPLNAEDNWWGSANGPEHAGNTYNVGSQGDAVDGDDVDFVPWLDAAPTAGASFAPITCDDGTSYASLQAGVDGCPAGGTVTAANGLYVESNTTIDKSLTLQGQSRAGVIVAPAAEDTGDIATTFGGSYQQGLMVAADDVTIRNLTVDGAANNLTNGGSLPDHYNFRIGILNYSEAVDGFDTLTIQDVNVFHVRRRGIALWPATTSGHVVSGCSIDGVEYQQAIMCAGYDVVIADNQINDSGAGISLFPELGATDPGSFSITGNTLTNIGAATGRYYGESWPVNAIYYRNPNYDKTVNISDNVLHSFGSGGTVSGMPGVIGMYVYNADSASVINGNTIDTTGAGGDDGGDWGIYLGGCAGTTVSGNTFTMDEDDSGIYLGRGAPDPASVVPNVVTGNTFTSASSYTTWTPPTPGSDSTTVDGTAIVQADDGHVFWMWENPQHTRNIITDNTIDGFAMGILMLGNGYSGTYYEVEADIGSADPADSNDIINCGTGVRVVETDGAVGGYLVNAAITGNTTTISGHDIGIDIDGSTATIEYNTVSNNTTGVFVQNGGTAVLHYNTFSGNTSYGVNNATGAEIDAEKNWWGHATGADHTSNPHGTGQGGDVASDDVDFVPWYATSTTSPTSENVETVHSGSTLAWSDTVQGGIDAAVAGDTVNIAIPGTYQEQIEIDKDLTLNGLGASTTILSPDTLTKFFATSTNNYPIVYIHDAASVTVQNLVVDGAGKGDANYRFSGIAFRNAGGTVDTVELKDIRDTPFSIAQHGVALYAYNDDTTLRTIEVYDSTFTGFQKNAMALNASSTTPLIVDIQGNSVSGAGPTDVTAQNGIQLMGAQATGTISGNTVSGIAYDNTAAATKWAATSILNYYADLDITDNTITGAHMGIYNNYAPGGFVDNNDLTIEKVGVYAYGILSVDPPGVVPVPFDAETLASEQVASQRLMTPLAADATLSVVVEDNTVTFSGTDNTSTYGIEVDAGYDSNDVSFTANRNTVTGFEAGIEVWKCQSDCGTGVFVSAAAHENCLSGNTYGLRSNDPTITVDAINNWWGDATGPYHSGANPSGTGDQVSDWVSFNPWLDACGGSVVDNFLNVDTGLSYSLMQDAVDAASPGDTIMAVGADFSGSEGHTTIDKELTIQLNGRTFGPGSSAFTVAADNVTIQGPGTLDGWTGSANSLDPGVRVLAGADNLILEDVEIQRWSDGIHVEGAVVSLKIVGNWIHTNTDAGVQVDGTPSGVVTIEGNLFKANGGDGVVYAGDGLLDCEYNSWGDLGGPNVGVGDGAEAAKVDFEPFTFVEFLNDMDPGLAGDQVTRDVAETLSFDVALKADAANVFGLTFKVTYDTDWLTLNSTTLSSPWNQTGRCFSLSATPGEVYYYCTLNPAVDLPWSAVGGTIATFNFSAAAGIPGEVGPWATYLDIMHQAVDTSAGAQGGAKIFVNNAGYNDPSDPARDITDTDDGEIEIHFPQYAGFVDLEGRANDGGAMLVVYDQVTKAGATLLAEAYSASSGAYTTSYVVGHTLTMLATHWLFFDRDLYLPTTAVSLSDWQDSHILEEAAFTELNLVTLLGGDATNDDYINVNDIGCIGNDYGKESGFTECGGAGSGGTSDVNGDGEVNILDLTLAAYNLYGTESPWLP